MAVDRPKFGVSLTYYFDMQETREIARRVEELGFDSLWVTENVHSGTPSLEPLMALSTFAASTTRITIGPAVLLLPLRNPVGLAHSVATLDKLSGGRVILGVGSGGEAREGFQAYGVPREERGRRSDEILEIMTALWTGEPVSFDGVHYGFSEYTLGARPVQRPHPPIWLGGEAPAVVRRVARWGQGYFPAHQSPAECAGLYDKVQALRREYGRGPVEFTNAAYLYVNLAESGEVALKVTKEVLLERYTYPVTHLRLGASCILGTVDDCVRLLKEYQAAGAAHIVLDPTCPKEDVLPLLERVSREILPHFK